MKLTGIVGHQGRLGQLLIKLADFVPLDCDITDANSVETAIAVVGKNLDLIVNCAGLPVDECEKNEKRAFEVNVRGLSNLHSVFGNRVLNISSDHVFSGNSWFLPKENTGQNPVNVYGFSKFGAEAISKFSGGKTIRLSRTLSIYDNDIGNYLLQKKHKTPIQVPGFFYRNYLTQYQAVKGIEYFVRNYDKMPDIVNYGGLDNVSMWEMVSLIANPTKVEKREKNWDTQAPRPRRGGFNISLAKKLGFPMYDKYTVANSLMADMLK